MSARFCFSWKSKFSLLKPGACLIHVSQLIVQREDHVLLNLLNGLRKRAKMQGLPSILSVFRSKFNKFNNSRARILDSIYHNDVKITLKSHFCRKNVIITRNGPAQARVMMKSVLSSAEHGRCPHKY